MKRLLFAVIVAVMLLLCFGCSNGEHPASEPSEASTTETGAGVTEETVPPGIVKNGNEIQIRIPSETFWLQKYLENGRV